MRGAGLNLEQDALGANSRDSISCACAEAPVRIPSPACGRRCLDEVEADEGGFRLASPPLIRPLLTQGAPSPAEREKEGAISQGGSSPHRRCVLQPALGPQIIEAARDREPRVRPEIAVIGL